MANGVKISPIYTFSRINDYHMDWFICD